jgi:hypothetical protein
VHTDLGDLVFGQSIGGCQCTRVDSDLSEVVEPRGGDKPFRLAPWQVERRNEPLHQLRDSLRVLRRRRIACVHDICHGLQRTLRFTP